MTRLNRLHRGTALALIVTSALACTSAPPTSTPRGVPGPSVPSPASPSASPSAGGPVPIVVDTDLAADDILAIMVLLRQPGVDLRAVTASGTGEVRCPAGLRNTRRLLAAFGRPGVPVACGRENPGPAGRWFPSAWRDGADAFYGVTLPAVDGESSRAGEPAPELLARLAAEGRTAGSPITLVPLGPWTNLQDALALDPAFAANLAGIHTMGGTIDAPGNIDIETTSPSDMVEWNFGADPEAVAAVLATDVPVTMVGLDATNHVPVPADIEALLATDTAAAGADIAHDMYLRNPFLAQGSSFWDTLAAVLLTDPSIATWQDVPVRTETTGRSAGRTTRDPGGRVVRAAMTADKDRFMAAFLAALRTGSPRPERPEMAGTLAITWDGAACTATETPKGAPGEVLVRLQNASDADAGLLMAGVVAPHTWDEAIDWIDAADFGDPNLAPPAWIVPVQLSVSTSPGESAQAIVTLAAGAYGVACGAGTWPDIKVTDGAAFTIGG